jgi:hypothetical protein
MYYYSVDTLIKIIDKEKGLGRVFISTKDLTKNHQELPDHISGIKVIKTEQKVKPKTLTDKDILIDDFDLQINQDKVIVMMIVYHKADNQLTTYKDGGYRFSYKLETDSLTYKLVSVDKISVNVHSYK